jgi:hypothetical protein
MLIFALELQRRSDRHGWGLTSLAAHPGWAATELIANGPAADAGLMAKLWRLVGCSARSSANPPPPAPCRRSTPPLALRS